MAPSTASTKKKSGTRRNQKKPDVPLTIFESEIRKLNDAQRRAVETIEGPVMVIAGPGTGKTQTVSMRVAQILRTTQMRPSNILCLTFSVSGATAMRDRLCLLIGPDAYGVTVSTIHGFCQQVIEHHPILFEEWSAREQISDIEKYRELNTIIDQLLPQLAIVNPKDPYSRGSEILSRISQGKREGKTMDDLERTLAEYDAELRSKSKEGTKAHEKNLRTIRKFSEFVAIFRRYQSMLEASGRYDYDDMILFVLRALAEEESLLASLQERYQYVLVDEFQDLNGAQWALVDRLTTFPSLPHEPNLFVVGDDDQAIYRFQGANLRNMLAFRDRFPAAPVIPLTVSYRSTQAILDAASSLTERNDERLVGKIPGLQKVLTAASGEEGTAPHLIRSPSDTTEPWVIADVIQERLAAGMSYDEIAVLAQTNAELPLFAEVLRARGIPVQLLGKADLLAHPLVMQALVLFEAIADLRRDGHLSSALACTCFSCHPADLGRIFSRARERGERVLDVLLSLPDQTITVSNLDAIIDARDALLDLSQKIPSRTVLDTVERILHLIVPPLSEKKTDRPAPDPLDLAAVEALFSFVKNRCAERPSYGYAQLLSDLGFYANPAFGQVRLTYELPHLVEHGVQLMTAHQSKGKEFATVILANFRERHWDNRRKPSTFAFPEDLVFGWGKERKLFEQSQDERRVAFVAMTRAKRELIFSCPREQVVGEKSRPVSPSAFFAEAGLLREERGTLRDPPNASLLLHRPSRHLDAELTAYLREKLETFALSATALTRFLTDPQMFLEVDLLAQPQRFEEKDALGLGYGNAVHWALRQWAIAVQRGDVLDAAQFIEQFGWHLRERAILTEKQRSNLLHLGQEALPRYFAQKLEGKNPAIHGVEREYHVRLGDIPIKGRIDRIDLASPTSALATVIDYKTGTPKTESQIRGGLDAGVISRTDEGNEFRQLVFYALLLEHGDPLLKSQSFVLDFIGERGEHPIQRTFEITDSERKDLISLIGDVWKKIQGLDFSPLEGLVIPDSHA
ncbi:ATP-dependent helicase [Candidatus Peregrinibacteria bacterium]|nr:ATP-dependent helicase [Candidatus Peregrinibacteria bacterium]MBI3816887.1 ATP-dependent helicase [Candidatus Peregrinibacteria bacterium]